jgi:hypothetical protein
MASKSGSDKCGGIQMDSLIKRLDPETVPGGE